MQFPSMIFQLKYCPALDSIFDFTNYAHLIREQGATLVRYRYNYTTGHVGDTRSTEEESGETPP